MFCRNCGQQIHDGASFCSNCGEQVVKSTGQTKQPAAQQQTPPIPPQTPPAPQPRYPQYDNPQFRQGAPVYSAAPQPQARSNSALLIVIIVLLALLVLIGGVLLFIKPGYLLNRDGGYSGIPALNSTPEPVQTGLSSGSSPDQALTVPPAQTPEAEENVITDYPQGLIGGYDPSEDASQLYSTSERPSLSEFEWCCGQFGFVRGAPGNAELLSDVKDYNGGWKAMIIYDPDDPDGIFTREFDNVIITVDDNHLVQVVIDWYLLAPDFSEISYLDDVADSVFNGSVTNTGISANGPALISLDNFWTLDGKQYATGSLTGEDGISAYLALVRP